jgi:peptide/nickel transport system permease protein
LEQLESSKKYPVEDLKLGKEVEKKVTFIGLIQTLKINKKLFFGTILLLSLMIISLIGPLIIPYGVNDMVGDSLLNPMKGHWLGTDHIGRDLMIRVVEGIRTSLLVAIASVVTATFIGTLLGILAGYKQGWLDSVIMRIMDMMFSIPSMLLAIVFLAALGTNFINLVIVIGLTFVPDFARVTRASTMAVKNLEFIQAAQTMGVSMWGILWKHILPNIFSTIMVQMITTLALVLFVESGLSFLGLGIQPPTPTLGGMISDGRRFIEIYAGIVLFPGVAIVALITSFNLIGDGIQELLNPRKQGVK